MRAKELIKEVNDPGHLHVPEDLLRLFTNRGWEIYGEGRDQVALGKPGTRYVLKIVGRGSGKRIDIIRRYVDFYRRNQRNPHFPRVGGDRALNWEGKTYYAYTQEVLSDLPGDERVLDYLQYAMEEMSHGNEPDFNRIPQGITVEEVEGLLYAVEDLLNSDIGDFQEFDLGNTYNIMQRPDRQMVIVDPFAGWDDDDDVPTMSQWYRT